MRKIIFKGYAKTVGTDYTHGYLVPETTTEKELDEIAWSLALENAEMYFDVVEGIDFDDDDEYACSTDEIDGYWEEYDPEKHSAEISYGEGEEWTTL